MELLVAATTGLVVAGAALTLCAAGNRATSALAARQRNWQHLRVAAALWATEWRGAGFDPTGLAGATVSRASPETLEFTADWNGNGALEPTGSNPNERLAWAAVAGTWKRGVNEGGRLPVAWPDSIRFRFRDGSGADLGARPPPASIRVVEAWARTGANGSPVVWTAARRNPGAP